MHLDKTIYPNPTKFDPERWIRATEQGVNLNKYLTTFSKGSRMCLGMKYVLLPEPRSKMRSLY